ncbi:MAG: restriction endonuclease subunit S [Finegoldia magna]|nr:restriction endonuclease subunit S [Finegoldia magna]
MSDYPKDWEEVKINNVSPIRGGYAFKSEMYVKNGVPIVRISNILSNETIGGDFECYKSLTNDNDFKLFNGSVVIAMSGATTGKVALLRLKKEAYYYQNQRVGYFKESDDINNCFLFYVVRGTSFKKYLNSILSTGAQPNISPKQINKFSFKKPPLEEQKAIADTLMTFDKHIENLEKLIEKKKMVRDGAVEDLMTGKTRLDGFDGKWEEIELGKICNIYDGTHQTPKYTNNGIRFVSVEDISNLKDSRKFISINDFRKDFKIYPENKDILMTRIGDIGTPCLLKDDEKIAYYVSLALLKNIKINSEYLYHYIRSSNFKNELDKRILHHATPIKINKNDIGKCQVNYPTDIKEQEAIASILTSMDYEIENLEKEKAKIEKIKVGAMDDLLTGKVRLI